MLSIIIPFSGSRLKSLDNTLYALTLQTEKPNEVIIVNDGGDKRGIIDILDKYENSLDVKYLRTRKFEIGQDTVPRNKGARLAKNKYLVFIDCDILLKNNALEEYRRSFTQHPDCVVLGMYDWLPPMEFTQDDIRDNWQKIKDWKFKRNSDDTTHNMMQDIRRISFDDFKKNSRVYNNAAAGLACFSGNLGIPTKIYWELGGYSDRMLPGLCDDGFFGMNVYLNKIGIVFNEDIIGLHQYHPRNIDWVVRQSKIEAARLDSIFGLNGKTPDSKRQKPIYEITKEMYKHWNLDPPVWIKEMGRKK